MQSKSIHPSKEIIENERLSSFSKYLNLGNNKLLFTGGCENPRNDAFTLDLITKEITNCPYIISIF